MAKMVKIQLNIMEHGGLRPHATSVVANTIRNWQEYSCAGSCHSHTGKRFHRDRPIDLVASLTKAGRRVAWRHYAHCEMGPPGG
jgi:hypothetical protein